MSSAARIQIVDYGLGNVFSIQQACRQVGLDPFISHSADDLKTADGIILPGVGAFGNAMEALKRLEIAEPLQDAARSGKPLLGICLGLQLLFDHSSEFGDCEGLKLISGNVQRLPDQTSGDTKVRIPNVGWLQVRASDANSNHPLMAGIPDSTWMYFVHSYFVTPANATDCLLTTEYGNFCYCCGVHRQNILGLQFHPEKSGPAGLRFYENWAATI